MGALWVVVAILPVKLEKLINSGINSLVDNVCWKRTTKIRDFLLKVGSAYSLGETRPKSRIVSCKS